MALGGLGVDAVADSGATAWGGGHGSSAAGIYGVSSWRAGTRAGVCHGGACAGGTPVEAGACMGSDAPAEAGASAAAAGGGVGTESEGEGEEREEEEARFGCEFNSCDWLHESQTLEYWREKKTFTRYIGLAAGLGA